MSMAHRSAQRTSDVTCLSNLLLQEAVTGSATSGRISAWAWQTSLLTFAAVSLLQAHADMDEERLSPGRVGLTLLWHLKSSALLWSLLATPLEHFILSGPRVLLPELVLLLDLAYLNCSTSLPAAQLLPSALAQLLPLRTCLPSAVISGAHCPLQHSDATAS